MSTRCQVLVVDDYSAGVLFYRHSDGYPDGVRKSLAKFMELVRTGKIRNNAEQAAGWLIIIGHHEYGLVTPEKYVGQNCSAATWPPTDWKVGAYEPASGLHGDIEYFYVVDVKAMEVRYTDAFDPDKCTVAQLREKATIILDLNPAPKS